MTLMDKEDKKRGSIGARKKILNSLQQPGSRSPEGSPILTKIELRSRRHRFEKYKVKYSELDFQSKKTQSPIIS